MLAYGVSGKVNWTDNAYSLMRSKENWDDVDLWIVQVDG